MVKRYAFTMVELIFAIVIIAISVMSLPMITQVTSKGVESNIVQEAIFSAATELNQVSTYYWDENSFDANTTLARVIDLGDCNSTTRLRLGHINQPYHRRCLDSNLTAPTDLADAGIIPDLDDTEHGAQNIFTNTTTHEHGYKARYNSAVDVTRTNVDFNGINQNIKRITITITNPDNGNTITKLNAYNANIGEIDYYKKRY